MELTVLLALLLGIRVAVSDLYARRVPNRWLAAVIGIGMAWMLVLWLRGQSGFPMAALLGGAAGLFALMPFYLVRWMGAGDVKYFATIGILLGWQALLPVWSVASLLCGAHAVVILAMKYATPRMPALQFASSHMHRQLESQPWWQRLHGARGGRQGMPYAAYLSVGVFIWAFAIHPGGA